MVSSDFASLLSFVSISLLTASTSNASWLPRQDPTSTFNSTQPASSTVLNSTSTATPSSGSNSTSTAPFDVNAPFPTDVGYLGTTKEGQKPFLVETDRIPGILKDSSVETRWHATDNDTFNIFQSLGNESPYFSSPIFPEFQQTAQVLSESCTVSQVHLLHRHGSRYPTSSATEGAPLFGASIANATAAGNFSASGPLSFLNTWKYQLGAELLVPLGAQQLFDSGVHAYYRYGKLYNETTQSHKPVVRTTSQSRILDSARFFTLGFFGWDAPSKVDMEVIIESGSSLGPGQFFNNTLAPYDTCNNSNTVYVGDTYSRPIWDKIYLPNATERLSQYVKGLNLTDELVYGMQSLCAYETVSLGYSNFCGLFTQQEWEGFEYDLDLQFQNDYGFGSPNGKAQGIGWAQELLLRLTNTTFQDANTPVTLQNTTLDESSTYFPLDQKFYFDFSHDDVIVSVLTALNFTQFGDYLPADKMDPNRSFVLSHITPFAARLYFEIVECSEGANSTTPTQYVRTILNDAVVPMDEGQGCKPSQDGLCLLSDFVKYQQENAVKAANFDYACFGDYNITEPVRNGTVYGSL